MANDKLQRAVRALEKHFETSSREGIVQLEPIDTGAATESTVEGRIAADVISTVDGALTSKELASRISEFIAGASPDAAKKYEKLLEIYVDGNTYQKDNEMSRLVGQGRSKGLSILKVNTIRITPAGRDVSAVSLLLNTIPTIELSRCVPYLTIEVQTGRPPMNKDGRLQGPSLLRFLRGSAKVNSETTDGRMVIALGQPQGEKESVASLSGMELFTSPQTLVDPDTLIDSDRAQPILDRFRPLMSIDRFEVEITPQVGFFAYRSANLDITLHDRSRLTEIADFIRPDLYSNTELYIEYGWSHPDNTSDNVFGVLLNGMRSREKYGIVNASYTFTRTGEVKLKLKLFTKGGSDINVVRLAEGGQALEAAKAVRELQKKIADVRLKLSQRNTKAIKEVRGEQQLFSAAEDVGSSLTLTKEQKEQLTTFLRKTRNANGAVASLRKELEDLYGPRGSSGKAKTFRNQVTNEIQERMLTLGKTSKDEDPFLRNAREKLKDVLGERGSIGLPNKGGVSFGRLMSMFVGVPLASTGKYADVQLLFYPFNPKAGAAADLNIAEFVIDYKDLKKAFTDLTIARRGELIPLREFMQYIANNFIDDMSNFSYGLRRLYRTEIGEGGVRGPPKPRSEKLTETQLRSEEERILGKLGIQDGVFKMPQLDVFIETVPLAPAAEGQPTSERASQTVLKLHFIDRTASAYESLGQMLLANREEDLRTLGDLPQKDHNDHKETFNRFVAKAKEAGLLTSVIQSDRNGRKSHVYELNVDVTTLKRFFMRNMPTIVYGTNNTGVKDASFATIQEQLLATVHMLRAGDAGPLEPTGLSAGNLPLRTLPARVSMTTIGCPLINYMQQFFIDFQTGTTVDNIYGVNRMSHEISSGKFETKIEFVPLDAYGRYESLVGQVGISLQKLAKLEEGQ